MQVNVILTADQEKTAQRLCDNGIGIAQSGDENLTITELVQWHLGVYFNNKRLSFLGDDKRDITPAEVAAIKAARKE